MNKIQQAEQALAEAKKEEKLQCRLRELEGLKKEYEGKCFGSHTFERHSAAAYMSAVYYENFYIEKDEIYALIHTIQLSHLDSFYKKSMKQIDYSRNVSKKQLTGQNDCNASYNLFSGYSFFRKEISLAKFKQLWEAGEEAKVIIQNAFRGKVPELEMESITQGDHDYETSIEKCILDMGIEMIDFKLFPNVHRCLEYRTLPMWDKRRWLPKQYAKPILQWQVKRLENECKDHWLSSSRRDALRQEIDILQNFINTQL
jgi:hypothetical protein